MNHRRNEMAALAAGLLAGSLLAGPAAQAAAEILTATPSTNRIYLDGELVRMEAYCIRENNYVKLRDLASALGVAVEYDGRTNSVYLGERPHTAPGGTVQLPSDGSRYVPKAGDMLRCTDGTDYTITDVSRWENSVFAPGPLPALPAPTCDWAKFPALALPEPEARHFTTPTGETMFIRNLYETRRMQYTVYNALGRESAAWKNGRPLASVSLTVPAELEPLSSAFWPWRASELENLVHSRPNSRFYLEAWDVYLNGVFQHTRYLCLSL